MDSEGSERILRVKPIKLKAVNLCTRSAHTLPLITVRSHVVNCSPLCANRAARNLATFSLGVSICGEGRGALPFGGMAELMWLEVVAGDIRCVVAAPEEGAVVEEWVGVGFE